ncbi:MAG: PEP-CTERM sorting domain-containing protein, partial [Roseibacillus sp.]|nr:PEP-CTERM sorting domain-containing protein [Roseibacillus sp.]
FNEGANRDRHFDIGVNGLLAVDDMTSEGNGVWTNSNSFSYNGTFSSTNAGGLDIVLGREPLPGDPNNTAFTGADNNAILQGVVISRIPEPSSSALLGLGLIGLLARRRR